MAAHMKKPHIQSIMMPLYQQATDIFSMKTPRNILVTSALPYANGPIHLGHILEHIQTDIWVRFQKMRGENCIYVCADDAHGAAIMLKAEEMQLSPEELIAQVKADHEKDFAAFHIHYDNYYTTHSEENRELSEMIYLRNRDAGDRKSTRLNSSHVSSSYAVFCLKKNNNIT